MRLANNKRFFNPTNLIILLFSLTIPLLCIGQNRKDIKNFNKSFHFSKTYTLNMDTNIRSDSSSEFNFLATYKIDGNGDGTFEFLNETLNSITLVHIKQSQIKQTNNFIYWVLGGEHSKRQEIIMTTISFFSETGMVDRLMIFDQEKKKAFVFY